MKIRKALRLAAVGTVVIFTLLVARIYMVSRETTLEFIVRITGLHLPPHFDQADTYDSGQLYSVARVTIPLEQVQHFAKENKFVPLPQANVAEWRHYYEGWLEHLSPANRHLPEEALYVLEDRTTHNKWECVLHPQSGSLWVVVFYPDPGGKDP